MAAVMFLLNCDKYTLQRTEP